MGNKGVIGIIGAMQPEVEALSAIIENKKIENYSGIDYISGTVYGHDVVLAKCGVGKVFAAVCTQTMILKYNPEIIINTGVGGSLSNDLHILDFAIADKVVQYDMDTTAVGDPLGLISGINKIYFECDEAFNADIKKIAEELGVNTKNGIIASGDAFVNDSAKKKHIVDSFGAIVCEMEGASIGHVAYINNTRFAILRSISDNGDENSNVDFATVLEKACDVSFKIWDAYFKSL